MVSPVKETTEMNVLDKKEKERRLVQLRKANPDYDIMAIQDALIRFDWDIEKAEKYIKESCRPKIRYNINQLKVVSPVATPVVVNQSPVKVQQSPVVRPPTQAPEIIKQMQLHQSQQPVPVQNGSNGVGYRRIKKPDSDRESDQGDSDEKPSMAVFDSDESDDDIGYMNKDRKAVFEFLNNAKVTDLINVKSLSQKKAELLLELRPFTDWCDLLTKVQKNKYVSTEILNNCQAFLDRRNSLTNIMKKCRKIVKRIGNAVEKGGTVLQQPKLLNDE